MQAFKPRGEIKEDINDETMVIPKSHLNNVCKIGCGPKTCRYLILGSKGFVCCKGGHLKENMDKLVKEKKIRAKGDNCNGTWES